MDLEAVSTGGLCFSSYDPRHLVSSDLDSMVRRFGRRAAIHNVRAVRPPQCTHPTSAVLSDAWYFAKRVTLSLALRS
jgi:hypothetical protein